MPFPICRQGSGSCGNTRVELAPTRYRGGSLKCETDEILTRKDKVRVYGIPEDQSPTVAV